MFMRSALLYNIYKVYNWRLIFITLAQIYKKYLKDDFSQALCLERKDNEGTSKKPPEEFWSNIVIYVVIVG